MERDALIAHGTSFLLQDRLMNCSDYSTAWVCRSCGSIISLGYDDVSLGAKISSESSLHRGPGGEYCRICRAGIKREEDVPLATKDRRIQTVKKKMQLALPKQNVIQIDAGGDLDVIAVPFVFRYLCAELASMGIAISLGVQ